MVEVEYMHICDYAFAAEGGKHCIIGMFDAINAPNFPATHPHMTVALKLQGQQHARVPVQIEVSKPNGDVLAHIDAEIGVGADSGAVLNFNMINTVFPDPGRYTVKVSSGGRTLASHSIRLQRMNVSTPTPVPQAH